MAKKKEYDTAESRESVAYKPAAYKIKCEKCATKLGDKDRKKQAKAIWSYSDGGILRARCFKHLTAK